MLAGLCLHLLVLWFLSYCISWDPFTLLNLFGGVLVIQSSRLPSWPPTVILFLDNSLVPVLSVFQANKLVNCNNAVDISCLRVFQFLTGRYSRLPWHPRSSLSWKPGSGCDCYLPSSPYGNACIHYPHCLVTSANIIYILWHWSSSISVCKLLHFQLSCTGWSRSFWFYKWNVFHGLQCFVRVLLKYQNATIKFAS